MLIGLGKDMTSFGFTRSKVKVTRVFFCKKWFPLIFLRTIYHRTIIFYMQTCLGEDMTSIDYGFTRSNVKVTKVTFVKKKWFRFHILHADWSW